MANKPSISVPVPTQQGTTTQVTKSVRNVNGVEESTTTVVTRGTGGNSSSSTTTTTRRSRGPPTIVTTQGDQKANVSSANTKSTMVGSAAPAASAPVAPRATPSSKPSQGDDISDTKEK